MLCIFVLVRAIRAACEANLILEERSCRCTGVAQADRDVCWLVGKLGVARLAADTTTILMGGNKEKLTPDACVEGSAVACCRRQGLAALQGLRREASRAAMAFKCAMLACSMDQTTFIYYAVASQPLNRSCAASNSGLELVSERCLSAQPVAVETSK